MHLATVKAPRTCGEGHGQLRTSIHVKVTVTMDMLSGHTITGASGVGGGGDLWWVLIRTLT